MADKSNFSKSKKILFNWTVGYFFCLWLILRFSFDFDMFSKNYWIKFFNETMHGFWGLVFVVTVYGAVLIYIASVMIIYNKNKPIVEIPVPDTVKNIPSNISKIFSNSKTDTKDSTPEKTNSATNTNTNDEYPSGLPPELHGIYIRAKNSTNTPKMVSDFNKPIETTQNSTVPQTEENESFPIPTDFDISDNLPQTSSQTNNTVPTFTDLNFDIFPESNNTQNTEKPTPEDSNKNAVIKYCEKQGIKYETLDEFVMMKKYLIYTHDDEDFWIMDEDNWFASGKQKKSPVEKLINLADQNSLGPVIYFATKNIMDIEHVINVLENKGIRVIMDLSELP